MFYTGDIRGHGRKRGIFAELLRRPPEDVDVLLMEGTNIGAETGGGVGESDEDEVEAVCAAIFRATARMAVVVWSAQNIDRLVTVYRAARRAGRGLVIDLYTASIARVTGNPNIPRPGVDWPHVRVYVPLWQRVKVKEAGAFERVEAVRPYRLFEEHLAADPARYVAQFGLSVASAFERAECLEGARAVWSLWPGYLKEPSGQKLTAFLQRAGVAMSVVHSSGHASVPDLQRLAAAIAPGRIVPIHSLGGHLFADYFADVTPEPDGAWWEV